MYTVVDVTVRVGGRRKIKEGTNGSLFTSLQKCHFLPNVCPRIGFKQTAKHVHLNAANDTHQNDLK